MMPRVLTLTEEPHRATSRILILAFSSEPTTAIVANLITPDDLRGGCFQTTDDGTYTVAPAEESCRLTLYLHNVSLMVQQEEVRRAVDALVQWQGEGCPTTCLSSDVCGPMAQWYFESTKHSRTTEFDFARYERCSVLTCRDWRERPIAPHSMCCNKVHWRADAGRGRATGPSRRAWGDAKMVGWRGPSRCNCATLS